MFSSASLYTNAARSRALNVSIPELKVYFSPRVGEIVARDFTHEGISFPNSLSPDRAASRVAVAGVRAIFPPPPFLVRFFAKNGQRLAHATAIGNKPAPFV